MSQLACLSGAILIAIGVVGYLGQPTQPKSDSNPDTAAGNSANGDRGSNDSADSGSGQDPASDSAGGEGTGTQAKRSWTALIPALFGVVLLVCGLISFKPAARKHAMHAAAGISLLGGAAGLMRGVPGLIGLLSGDPDVNRRTVIFLWLMVLVCFGFVFAAVNSFISARKAREAEAGAE